MKAKRIYKVVDAEGAKDLGWFPKSDFNRYALVALRGDTLDTFIAWGYQREPLDKKAAERNKDIAMLGKMIGKANDIADAEESVEA